MRYEGESRTWSTAAAIVRDRVRALPEFARLRAELVATAVERCRGKSVAEMRALGGFSGVLHALTDALPDACRVNVGSKLLPWSLATELAAEVGNMRGEVQARLAKDAHP